MDQFTSAKDAPSAPVLGAFVLLSSLWEASAGPLFRSEQSARWFLRMNRAELVAAKAIAIHAGRMLIHPERFSTVAESVALRQAAIGLTNVETGTTQVADDSRPLPLAA